MRYNFLLSLLLLLFSGTCVLAQKSTSVADRDAGYQQRLALEKNSPTAGLEAVNIGPTIMSGRVTDLAVDPNDPTHFYAAYASGGLWETHDNGITFSPLFEREAVMTIGAIDVHWPSGTIYLGSGEVNSSRSSYAGNGMYKSTDGGKTWMHLGLDDTHHIGRVIVDAKDPNTVWVAALGHLYGRNLERGIYKTTDGGKSWSKTLFVDDQTGAVELVQDPRNPNELFAATWQRQRWAWDFLESGPGSGIYHSKDGGDSWKLITTGGDGFPTGEGAGRIGLAVSYDDRGNRHLYASIDNYFRRDKTDEEEDGLTKDALRNMSAAAFADVDDKELGSFLRSNGFPRDLKPSALKKRVADGELRPVQLVEYLEDANSLLFDTPVKGFELYHTTNDGRKWTRTHEDYLDGIYFSYGYYFGFLTVHPEDPSTIYALGVPMVKSTDGGKTWSGANGDNVHSDHHVLWINPDRPDHLINGNDGGVNISYDGGENWFKANMPSVGQFYAIAVDDHPDGYRVYGGLQDNGTWRGPGNYRPGRGWHGGGQYPYERLFGGDGMQVEVDPRDNETVYVGLQFGNYARVNPKTGERKFITPKHELGERPYRWNWQSPILVSKHVPELFYMGSNFLHRSFNRGDKFEIISPDLTQGGKKGDVAYGTLTTIDESPLRFGLLYVGSDDGLVHRTTDGGANWVKLNNGLPKDLWVSRVEASHHDENVVYLTLNGYRYDDFNSYVYRSEDQGGTWERIGMDLPAEPVNVILEDPANPELLYVGTDHGLYVSMDGGKSFSAGPLDLPNVAVHDLVVQTTAKDLVIGTHGRSIYRTDVTLLQQIAGQASPSLTMGKVAPARYSSRYGASSWYSDDTSPKRDVAVYSPVAGKGMLEVMADDGTTLQSMEVELAEGFGTLSYDLSVAADKVAAYTALLNKDKKEDEDPVDVKAADNGAYYLRAGKYTLKLSVGDQEAKTMLEVK
ncbi:glycosyl hydrolase [Lewinella sp. W8]|uniref:WD40/YVTN/BNR-like repeat-containing protein n=1 Tax=Lewinella sp. W8 TaxID=2528208 RepID=UPI00106775F4|nr:glycosyl hydrolase [Lewinella sp. W8]MTB53451.1 glycosyl hydrolase [Lewinella sp. W8]